MAATIELADGSSSFPAARVEWAYGLARKAMKAGDQRVAEAGERIARQRHPKLLKALERMAEVLHAEAEAQQGRTVRDHGTPFSERVWPTEASLVREAFRCCDERPNDPGLATFSWIYGAAAMLAGLYHY